MPVPQPVFRSFTRCVLNLNEAKQRRVEVRSFSIKLSLQLSAATVSRNSCQLRYVDVDLISNAFTYKIRSSHGIDERCCWPSISNASIGPRLINSIQELG